MDIEGYNAGDSDTIIVGGRYYRRVITDETCEIFPGMDVVVDQPADEWGVWYRYWGEVAQEPTDGKVLMKVREVVRSAHEVSPIVGYFREEDIGMLFYPVV